MAQRIYSWFGNKKFFDALPKRVSSAAMVLQNTDNDVLIVKANYKDHWTFPGGIIDPGETPMEAAIREMREETGLTVTKADVKFVAVLDRISEHAQSYQFIFYAALPIAAADNIVLQPSEIDAYAFVTVEQIIASDRHYAESVLLWAKGQTGYIEQVIDTRAIYKQA
ncbi:MAG: NUDIX domain-containing protein [Candidatus Saccharimonadales bacterium]